MESIYSEGVPVENQQEAVACIATAVQGCADELARSANIQNLQVKLNIAIYKKDDKMIEKILEELSSLEDITYT